MVGWHEPEQTLGDGEGQGGLECCSPRGHKESDTTEQLNNRFFPGSPEFQRRKGYMGKEMGAHTKRNPFH